MKWIIENWYIVFVLIVVLGFVILGIIKFLKLPTETQIKAIKKWLLYAVEEAEKELGSQTGKIKLSKVYGMFVNAFPYIAKIVAFDTFSIWVDEALEEFKNMLESNVKLQAIIKGE